MKLIHWDKWLSWNCFAFVFPFLLLFVFPFVSLVRLLVRSHIHCFPFASVRFYKPVSMEYTTGDMQSIVSLFMLFCFRFVVVLYYHNNIHTDKWFLFCAKISIQIRFRRQRISPDIQWSAQSLECETSNHHRSNIPSHKIDDSWKKKVKKKRTIKRPGERWWERENVLYGNWHYYKSGQSQVNFSVLPLSEKCKTNGTDTDALWPIFQLCAQYTCNRHHHS